MSSVSTTTVASSARCSNLYDTPVHDAVCAMPYSGNHTDIMSACCGDAKVVSYYNNCGLYCLSKEQSVYELTECLYKNGAAWQDVFCKGNASATATAAGEDKIPASASASVVSGGTTNKSKYSTGSSSSSGSGSSSTSSESAALGFKPRSTITTSYLTIGALVLCATLFGAFQI